VRHRQSFVEGAQATGEGPYERLRLRHEFGIGGVLARQTCRQEPVIAVLHATADHLWNSNVRRCPGEPLRLVRQPQRPRAAGELEEAALAFGTIEPVNPAPGRATPGQGPAPTLVLIAERRRYSRQPGVRSDSQGRGGQVDSTLPRKSSMLSTGR